MARTYLNPRMDHKLDDLMEFGHVVAVMPDGRVIDCDERFNRLDEYAPEVLINYDGTFKDAQIGKEHDAEMADYLRSQGWEVLSGYSGQHQYAGPIMHTSELIGGGLERRIREEPGFWVALTVEIHPGEDDPEHESNGGSGESEYVGWIVARKIGSDEEIEARTRWIAEDLAPWDIDPAHPDRLRPTTDEGAAMAAPVVIYRGEIEDAARNMLVTRLIQDAHLGHVQAAGETARYLAAASEILDRLTFSVRPAHRIMRVRAMLMPKESA